tara:strand:- start:1435 stop:1899 length:465 start_codon:yes stop_codon:yes gene_type:complete
MKVETYKGHKVPEGATHFQMEYQDMYDGFYKKIYDAWFFFNPSNTDGWVIESSADDSLHGCSIELPEQPTKADDVVEHDNVNHPEHYQSDNGIECIDAIRAALGHEGFIAYCRGNTIKYNWRSGSKNSHTEDLKKGAWYSNRAAIEIEKAKGGE